MGSALFSSPLPTGRQASKGDIAPGHWERQWGDSPQQRIYIVG